MIRTAILAGILLVMLSMAYTRQGSTLPVQPAALLEQPQVKAVTQATKAIMKQAAPAASDEPQQVAQPAPERPKAVAKEELPAPAKQEPVLQPAVVAEQVSPSASVAAEAPPKAAAPISLLPPAAPVQAPAHPEVATAAPVPRDLTPLIPSVPAVPPAAEPAAPIQSAVPKVDEMPTIAVAKRPVMMPRELPLPGEQNVADAGPAMAAAETASKSSQPAPKFMTPQERSRDLYRLAREMEETFINKLAP